MVKDSGFYAEQQLVAATAAHASIPGDSMCQAPRGCALEASNSFAIKGAASFPT